MSIKSRYLIIWRINELKNVGKIKYYSGKIINFRKNYISEKYNFQKI